MTSGGAGRKPRHIRSQNKKLILDLYRNNGDVTTGFLARQTKLSRTTIVKINEELLSTSMILPAGKGTSTREGGKKPVIYRFNPGCRLVISFHIEYDGIRIRVFDLSLNEVLSSRIGMDRDSDIPKILEKMESLMDAHGLREEQHTERFLACTVAIHGDVDSANGICIHSTYFPSWGTHANLKAEIKTGLGITCPLIIDNWVRLKAYGENRIGFAKGHESVVLINAGRHGVSAGILIKDEIYPGKNHISGEIGHMCLHPGSSVACACGSMGCFEALVSCQELLNSYHGVKGIGNLSLEELFRAADNEDEDAIASPEPCHPVVRPGDFQHHHVLRSGNYPHRRGLRRRMPLFRNRNHKPGESARSAADEPPFAGGVQQ